MTADTDGGEEIGTSSGDVSHQPSARLAAKLGHSEEVRRVAQRGPLAAKIYTTNNGLRHKETRIIRRFGYEVVGVSPRFNMVTVARTDRYEQTDSDRSEGGESA